MKYPLVIICFLFLANSCKTETPELKTVSTIEKDLTNNQEDLYKDYAKAQFNIEGMTCALGCAKTIEKKISKLSGVRFVNVDFENKLAMVQFDSNKVSTNDFIKTVNSVSGVYKVKNIASVTTFTKSEK